jgi:hypothetical protein
MSWKTFPTDIPLVEQQVRWRIPLSSDPKTFTTFIAWMRKRGAGYSDVISPTFDHWDGYRVLVPTCEWQPCDQIPNLKTYEYTDIQIEGITLDPCPFCQQIPTWDFYSDYILAAPFSSVRWSLRCCAWSRSPQGPPREIAGRRHELLHPTPIPS